MQSWQFIYLCAGCGAAIEKTNKTKYFFRAHNVAVFLDLLPVNFVIFFALVF